MSHYSSVFCLLVLLGNLLIHSEAQNSLWDKDKDKFDLDKPGYFHTCGKNGTAYIRYTPSKLSFGDVMHIDVYFTTAFDGSSFYLQFSVYDPEETMEDPVFTSGSPITCKEINKYVMPGLCPFRKGVPVNITNFQKPLPMSAVFPIGTYVIKTTAYDKDPAAGGKETLCLTGTVCILGN